MICFSTKGHGPVAKRVKALVLTTMLVPFGVSSSPYIALASDSGFAISVDGETIAGDETIAKTNVLVAIDEAEGKDGERLDYTNIEIDRLLDRVDIQVKFDGLEVTPQLNVLPVNLRRTYEAGEYIGFNATTNYASWISRAEVRIYRAEDGLLEQRDVIEIVPITLNAEGAADWRMPVSGDSDYAYVLRVYDEKGRFDETEPLTLHRTHSPRVLDDNERAQDEHLISAGRGRDRTALRNIPVFGGAVTIYGRNVPPGYQVAALGQDVPVDVENSFVVQQILPPGDHLIDVDVYGDVKTGGLEIEREINIPSNDWFYIGLADLTIGKRFGGDAITDAEQGEYDDVYSNGRLAFYLKGKIRGKYLLTAAGDTGERPLSELLRDLDGKNASSVLKRIDPDEYYPVYGDDSTSMDDAPTSGKFYVRLERGDSHVMWGDFKTKVNGAEYIRSERQLYGASAVYKSENVTDFGESKVQVSGYAAQPDTLPQRDVLRGTGGSAYFLKRQDINIGSETVTIEVRDSDTNRVISRRTLVYGVDYDIDYSQGVIILEEPLSSSSKDGDLVRDGALGGDVVNLVVQYEYTPTAGQTDGYSYGGRGQVWLGDNIRLGATAMREETGNGAIDSDQDMIGADIMLRHSDGTWIKGEIAQTEGPGFSTTVSDDGGLTSEEVLSAGASNRVAQAWRVEGQVDIPDFTKGEITGKLRAYYEDRDEGFATLDYNVGIDERLWGASLDMDLATGLVITGRYDDYANADGDSRREASGEIGYEINEYWKAKFGVKYSDLTAPTGGGDENGTRVDVAGEITYAPDDDRRYYAFAQGTVSRTGGRAQNNRLGAGADIQLSEKIGVEAEVSYGTTGWGALGAITYDPTSDEHYYFGYELDGERAYKVTSLDGSDLGNFVFGAKRKYDDHLSAFTETNYDVFGKERSLTSIYGVTYTPDDYWKLTGGLEFGQVIGTDDDIERKAISLGVAYHEKDKVDAKLRTEIRFDDTAGTDDDITSFLIAGALGYKVDPSWRLVADFDAVLSQEGGANFRDGDYIQASIGAAYRPVENDRFNALFKYTYLYDLPATDQVTETSNGNGPRQRSHVLSADGIWQANDYIQLGAKYGMRFGEVEVSPDGVSPARGSGVWESSDAQLGILRADLHVVRNWDLLVEGRALWSHSADTIDWGAVVAGYRHIGDNMKVGIGYNFGRFSDDLLDHTFDDHGVFLNVVGKF